MTKLTKIRNAIIGHECGIVVEVNLNKIAEAACVLEHQLEEFRDGAWPAEVRRQANLALREAEEILVPDPDFVPMI